MIAIRASADDEPLLALLTMTSSARDSERIYLIDPLGNLMMSYAADARPKGMLEDMKRLLRLLIVDRLIMEAQRRLIWFRRLALAGALLAAAVVVLGAWVRLTDAGLGCPDWPGCYGHLYPQADHQFTKALHEMVHRYFASSLGLIIIGLNVWAMLEPQGPRTANPPVPALLFFIVCLQGALGALTVTLLLTPLIVTAHLLGGLTTLGDAVVAVADP